LQVAGNGAEAPDGHADAQAGERWHDDEEARHIRELRILMRVGSVHRVTVADLDLAVEETDGGFRGGKAAPEGLLAPAGEDDETRVMAIEDNLFHLRVAHVFGQRTPPENLIHDLRHNGLDGVLQER